MRVSNFFQALSPFKYALAAFSLVILEEKYFVGEGGELVKGDDVRLKDSLNPESFKRASRAR